MEGDTRKRAIQVRKMIGFLECFMKWRTVTMEVKRELCDGIIVPTITYAGDIWVWNKSQ